MQDGVETARVLVAPDSFSFAQLFEEASLLDDHDYDELAGVLKRPYLPESDSESAEPESEGPAIGNSGEVSERFTRALKFLTRWRLSN